MLCLYCAKNELKEIKPTNSPSFNVHTYLPYRCQHCGIGCTRLELEKENSRLFPRKIFLGNKPPQANREDNAQNEDEDTILRTAGGLMVNKQWEQALDALFKTGAPFKRPAEFLIYRDI